MRKTISLVAVAMGMLLVSCETLDLNGILSASSGKLDNSTIVAGLFTVLAKEERMIRQNPAARTTALLKKVFGNNAN